MRLLALFLAPLLAGAAMLPGSFGSYRQTSVAPLPVKDAPFWNELGLTASESGVYESAGKRIQISAWRVADSTAGLAAYDALQPESSKDADEKLRAVTTLSSAIPGGTLAALGNVVVRIDGYRPSTDELANFFRSVPRFEQGPLPLLPGYLPTGARAGTERYLIGPNAMKEYLPEVSPSTAAFSLGAEADVAEFGDGQKMAIFSYPTPAIARDRLPAFQKIPGTLVKRTGTLVVMVVSHGDVNADESLISQVRYKAAVTLGNKPASSKDNPGNLFLNIVYLVLILSGFCIVSGIVVGGLRYMFRRSGTTGDGDQMITLHLEKR